MFPENELAMRYMDNFEKDEIRKKYCELVEAELLSAKEEAKRLKANAEEALNSVSRQIKDYAAKVTEGTKEKKLPPTKTFRIALNGYYLFYSVINGRVLLVKAEKISSYDKSSLWAQEDRNRTAMMELYPLEVHHMRYKVNGMSIVGHELEHLDCLVTLCASCHEKVHKGVIRL